MNMRPGTFMDRPAYSIHGNRADVMEKQIVTPPSTQLLFYEIWENRLIKSRKSLLQ